MPRSTAAAELPLRHPVYHVLLALASRDLHGLGIADEVEHTSEGAVEVGPATLYRTLSELVDAGWIQRTPAPSDNADPRRKYYGITSRGREVLARETERLQRLVATARSRNAVPERAG